jgi:hypothetical protein
MNMKTPPSFSGMRILPVVFLIVLFCSCSKEKEENDQLDKDYKGTLRFEYTRSFPAFSAIIDMDVDLYRSGDIIISQPSSEHFDATGEVPNTVKLRETGDIIITSLSGSYKTINGSPYVIINANTLIDGTMTVWGWDDDRGWIFPIDIPYTNENPVESPMNFDFHKVTMSEDIIGGTVPAFQGDLTVRWILGLMPALPK